VKARNTISLCFDKDAQDAGARDESLCGITLPSLVVGASHDDYLPWTAPGGRLAAELDHLEPRRRRHLPCWINSRALFSTSVAAPP
jgi:hypothetical protein